MRETAYETPVVQGQPEEAPQLLPVLWQPRLMHRLNLLQVHLDPIIANDVAEILHLGPCELTLRELNKQFSLANSPECLLEVLKVFVESGAVDKEIIHVYPRPLSLGQAHHLIHH